MALKDRLNATTANSSGIPCSVGVAEQRYAKERPAELAEFLDALWGTGDQRYTASHLATALTAEGFRVGDQQVRRHRRKVCRCFLGAN